MVAGQEKPRAPGAVRPDRLDLGPDHICRKCDPASIRRPRRVGLVLALAVRHHLMEAGAVGVHRHDVGVDDAFALVAPRLHLEVEDDLGAVR
jgi:hypothetical protein